MRKLFVVVLLAALVVVVLPAQASARHTLGHKVRVLEKKVGALQREVNCMRRTGAATFVGYAYYEGSLEPGGGPYPVHANADDLFDTNWAANFTQAVGGSADYWLLTVHNTRSCRRKFPLVRSPYARAVIRTGAMTRLHRLSRIQ
jgi:hypothetical protein